MIGTTLKSRYKIIEQLGEGGFGETFIAEDLDIPSYPKPRCVVKKLKLEQINPYIIRLFHQEAKILYKLGEDHEQIPNLKAYFIENSEFYLIQDLIIGQDLSQEMLPGIQLSETYVIKFLEDILNILDFVHQNNVIHRDIKPSNIIRRGDGKLFLIDFGAVKQVKQKTLQTSQTTVTISIGTTGYMPSEQALGKPKYSSDIYALGMVAIQALTGILPHELQKDDNEEIIWQNLTKVSDDLATIINKMVRYHFLARYANAGEVLEALINIKNFESNTDILVKPQSKINNRPITQLNTSNIPITRVNTGILPLKQQVNTSNIPVITQQVNVSINQSKIKHNTFSPDYLTIDLEQGIILEMLKIPTENLLIGSTHKSSSGFENELSSYQANTIEPFYLGKYPITQDQWEAIIKNEPWLKYKQKFWGNNKPAIGVSWHNAKEFCQRLSRKTGQSFNLPTEAQWEYAARAIHNSKIQSEKYYFGNDNNKLKDYGWYSDNSGGQTHEVGQKKPNNFGLYDMYGNIWEWCEDNWNENYNNKTSNNKKLHKDKRVLKGGSWFNVSTDCCSANHYSYNSVIHSDIIGFRVLCFL